MAAVKNQLDKRQVIVILEQFFKHFQDSFHHSTPPNLAIFEKFLAQNFVIVSNANVIAKGLPAYLNRIQKLQKQFKNIEITGPIEEPVFSENKIAIIYDVNFTPRNGSKAENRVIAIATIEDNKFTKWEEVSRQKGEDWLK